ncbi:MAG TPA: hypothetical protein VN643_27480 [Pyrinomonadaceae bacterium]|nr:hypothetical protein [Pyrinomonadaceae bacterium]
MDSLLEFTNLIVLITKIEYDRTNRRKLSVLSDHNTDKAIVIYASLDPNAVVDFSASMLIYSSP